jgi:hypothetical protein
MPDSFALPPVEYCLGTKPIHAANSRPLWNATPPQASIPIKEVCMFAVKAINCFWVSTENLLPRVGAGFVLPVDPKRG